MKKYLSWIIVGLLGLLVGGLLVYLVQDQKTAYINTAVLMEKSNAIKVIKANIKEDVDKAKGNVDTLQMEFEEQMKAYERKVSLMSEKEKQMAQELLNMKRQELIRYQQAIEGKLNQEEQKMTGEALKAINEYISEYGKRHHYKVIFATTNGNIAYADESLDITEEIVKGVNEAVK